MCAPPTRACCRACVRAEGDDGGEDRLKKERKQSRRWTRDEKRWEEQRKQSEGVKPRFGFKFGCDILCQMAPFITNVTDDAYFASSVTLQRISGSRQWMDGSHHEPQHPAVRKHPSTHGGEASYLS